MNDFDSCYLFFLGVEKRIFPLKGDCAQNTGSLTPISRASSPCPGWARGPGDDSSGHDDAAADARMCCVALYFFFLIKKYARH